MTRLLTMMAVCALTLTGCDAPDHRATASRPGVGENGRRDLRGTGVETHGTRGGLSYAAYDVLRDEKGSGLAFAGYGCLSNCADVIGGYQRAQQRKITNSRLCRAPTWGELEGCVAFTQALPPELSNVPPLKPEAAR